MVMGGCALADHALGDMYALVDVGYITQYDITAIKNITQRHKTI